MSVHQNKSGFHKLIELLQNSDLSFANMECAIQDGEDWPAFGSGMGWAGTVMGAPPSMIDELKFMGISAVYAANNHVADFGELGILTTIDYLKQGGMPYAGIGASLIRSGAADLLGNRKCAGRADRLGRYRGLRQMMDLPFSRGLRAIWVRSKVAGSQEVAPESICCATIWRRMWIAPPSTSSKRIRRRAQLGTRQSCPLPRRCARTEDF